MTTNYGVIMIAMFILVVMAIMVAMVITVAMVTMVAMVIIVIVVAMIVIVLRTERTDRTGQTNLTFQIEFQGNLFRAVFAILALFSLGPSYLPITIHIMKAYDESYSKIIRRHKYKDKDNDKDNAKDKDTDKVLEKPNICYIFEILMTYSFKI